MKRNVTKEIKSIARERVGRVKARKVFIPKPKRRDKYPKAFMWGGVQYKFYDD